jgi:hypothetical protein
MISFLFYGVLFLTQENFKLFRLEIFIYDIVLRMCKVIITTKATLLLLLAMKVALFYIFYGHRMQFCANICAYLRDRDAFYLELFGEPGY